MSDVVFCGVVPDDVVPRQVAHDVEEMMSAVLKLAKEMDGLASVVVVYGMVPQRRLLSAVVERCLSWCVPFDMLVSLACGLVSARLSTSPMSTWCVALCICCRDFLCTALLSDGKEKKTTTIIIRIINLSTAIDFGASKVSVIDIGPKNGCSRIDLILDL